MNILHKRILLAAQVAFVCMFLIIIAGAVVRTTGSGMGCPDWPKCFGYYIPPTSPDQVYLLDGHSYQANHLIIHNDTLWKVHHDFTYTGESFWKEHRSNTEYFTKYPKHNYAEFTVTHTWVEYVNRLLTGVLGIPIILLFVLTLIQYIKERKPYNFIFALLAITMILFEAWLGKLVVDENLKTSSISLHMVGTLGIIISLLLILFRNSNYSTFSVSKRLRNFLFAFFLLHMVQLLMGTQVREQVDLLLENGINRSEVVPNIYWIFKVHRSFSIIIVLLAFGIFLEQRKLQLKNILFTLLYIILGIEALAGIGLAYYGLPHFLQPTHLVLSTALFAISLAILVRSKSKAA